jgi:putative proteasome-type protease
MTYCVGVILDDGIVFGSDSRTHAGVDNFATFSKMSVFERKGDRVVVLLSSGNLAGTQAVISVLKQRGEAKAGGEAKQGDETRPSGEAKPKEAAPNIWTTRTMFDTAAVVSDAMRDIERRDAERSPELVFNASFILGGQIKGEPMRLFRIYAEGNYIEASVDTPYHQTGEAKYGKPILDRVITPSTTLADASKCVLVSFDSTMRSNLSVGMPIDLICYQRDALEVTMRRKFEQGDPYFSALSKGWSEGVRTVFRQLPDLKG